MRVLLSAYSCFPNAGSEPGLGWGLASHLSDRFDLTVITSTRNRDKIEPQLRQLRHPARFAYVDAGTEGHALVGNLFVTTEYARWQLRALRIAHEMHLKANFDLVHHVTFVSAWLPSFMGKLGIPFVWNAGSAATTPSAFLRSMSARAALEEAARTARVRLALPAARRVTVSPKTAIITSSPEARWPQAASTHALLVGALTNDELALCGAARPVGRRAFRVACVGRLLGWKGFELAVRSFARARLEFPDLELWVIGSGPERSHLARLAAKLGCCQQTRFLGGLTRSATLAALKEVDVVLHPSLREQFGYVILEAMASGVPTICLATAGAGLLTAGVGRPVPLGRPAAVVKDLTDALVGFASDPVACADAGAYAREHAKSHWNWHAMADRIGAVYEAAVKGRP
jgi:glycosyltransferase involved in cell wall biosynthesis